MNNVKPLVLTILDGWGEWEVTEGNAILQANLPTVTRLNQFYPKILLEASGVSVGLPWGSPGNSEVGHQTLGTGQVIFQYLPTIDNAILNGAFFKNQTLLEAMRKAKAAGKKVHFLGLLSDGGVHAHINHLFALLELAKSENLEKVYVHAIADGRDVSPESAEKFLLKLNEKMNTLSLGKLATICGRYYTMDRNENWDRVEKAFLAMTRGEGIQEKDFVKAVKDQYQKNVFDEYLEPIAVDENGKIEEGDTVIFFNFRKDRARQISEIFLGLANDKLKVALPVAVDFVCFTQYAKDFKCPTVFAPQEISFRLGEILAQNNLKQFRIAETEKYAHVTYFFNGGNENSFVGEERKIIPSKNAASYDTIPEMSALEVTDEMVKALAEDKYNFLLVNYANPDMVGHTGNLAAGIKAVETVDRCLERLILETMKKGGRLLITADHGNAEEMINLKTKVRDTEHSANPVPCWLVTPENHFLAALCPEEMSWPMSGMLEDIAPTAMELLGINPSGFGEISGASLTGFLNQK